MDILIVVLLILLSIFLVIVEALLLPGVTVAALGALAATLYASWLVFDELGFMWGVGVFTLSIILSTATLFICLRRKTVKRLELKTNSDSAVPNVRSVVKVGDTGVTLSRLAPMGSALIAGNKLEAKSVAGFIDQKVEIKVIGFDDNVVFVEKL